MTKTDKHTNIQMYKTIPSNFVKSNLSSQNVANENIYQFTVFECQREKLLKCFEWRQVTFWYSAPHSPCMFYVIFDSKENCYTFYPWFDQAVNQFSFANCPLGNVE